MKRLIKAWSLWRARHDQDLTPYKTTMQVKGVTYLLTHVSYGSESVIVQFQPLSQIMARNPEFNRG